MPAVFPRGLNEKAIYAVRPIYGHLTEGTPRSASGAYWMGHGVQAVLVADYDAAALVFERTAK
jgi:alpha-galactosidase